MMEPEVNTRVQQTVLAGRDLLRRSEQLARKVAILGLLLALGLALGLGLRAVLLPVVPPPLAKLFGSEDAMDGKGAGRGDSAREIAFWKSSMIPNFVSPKPGPDPMGMDLIPVYVDELAGEKFITLSLDLMENIGLRTVRVEHAEAERIVRTIGQVDYAEPLLGDLTLKVGGWIEELLVDHVGQRVERGQPLFRFYSPEVVTAQEEFLLSPRRRSDATGQTTGLGMAGLAIYSAYDKLRYWDVPEDEIEAIRNSGQSRKAVTFRSPFSGWVIEKHANEGMHMKPGSRFYRIADLSTMWVYVYAYEYQLPWIRVGQSARLTLPFRPGDVFEGKVIYIYPSVDPQTRQIRVRLEFSNAELDLKPQMYADVEISAGEGGRSLVVPLDAVIHIGDQEILDGVMRRKGITYVQIDLGKFEPREVVLGEDLQRGQVAVLSGLKDGEEVVVAGQFLLDTERKVKESNLRMFMPGDEDQKDAP